MISQETLKKAEKFRRRESYSDSMQVRLTPEMKLHLDECAKKYGYTKLSSFARDVLLAAMDDKIMI